jgi:hypothetical protein
MGIVISVSLLQRSRGRPRRGGSPGPPRGAQVVRRLRRSRAARTDPRSPRPGHVRAIEAALGRAHREPPRAGPRNLSSHARAEAERSRAVGSDLVVGPRSDGPRRRARGDAATRRRITAPRRLVPTATPHTRWKPRAARGSSSPAGPSTAADSPHAARSSSRAIRGAATVRIRHIGRPGRREQRQGLQPGEGISLCARNETRGRQGKGVGTRRRCREPGRLAFARGFSHRESRAFGSRILRMRRRAATRRAETRGGERRRNESWLHRKSDRPPGWTQRRAASSVWRAWCFTGMDEAVLLPRGP